MRNSEVISKVQKAIDWVVQREYTASQYINCEDVNGDTLTIRVSDHKCNPLRMRPSDISFVVVKPIMDDEEDDEVYSPWSNAKKSFRDIPNSIFLNEDGGLVENWETIEECLSFFDVKLDDED